MSGSKRGVQGGELPACWALLVFWLLGFACEIATVVVELRAFDTGDLSAFLSNALAITVALLSLVAWLLAIVLSVRLRRWGWLVACALVQVAIPVFAVVMLVEAHTTARDRKQEASFAAALAEALAQQDAER